MHSLAKEKPLVGGKKSSYNRKLSRLTVFDFGVGIVLQYDFEQSLSYWVVTTAHAMERALNEELAPHGITYRQWQVLGWLALEGELSQAELAERMRIEAPTLAGIVDRMERDGWLVRHGCPSDRRKKLLRSSERVEPIWATITEAARRVRARASRGFNPDQIEHIMKSLAAVQENLRSTARPPEDERSCSKAIK